MYTPSFHTLLRASVFCALSFAGLAGCSHTPSEYTWSHPASGEYLFAFDVGECGTDARPEMAPSEGSALESPEFFACMRERGYYIVDVSTGQAVAVDTPALVSPQATR